jgi:hypothetical protein
LEVDIISVYFCLCLLNISVTVTKVLSSGWKEKLCKFNDSKVINFRLMTLIGITMRIFRRLLLFLLLKLKDFRNV